MEKDHNLDKSSPTYVPTYQEMGYTTEQFEATDWSLPQNEAEWERRKLAFQTRHREKLTIKKKETKEMKMQKFVDHWYSTLNSKEVDALINDSRKLSDVVFDKLLESEKLPAMRRYYEDLRERVRSASFKAQPADLKKLARFPMYDKGTNSLTGSVYAFAKLWSHVFSVRRNRGIIISTKD